LTAARCCCLQALAVSDTLVLLIVFLLRSLRYVAELVSYDYRDAHRSLYGWLFPCAYLLRMVNAWLTVLLTVDRYIAVCRPLHAQRLCTIQRTYTSILAVTVVSVVFCLPRFFENHNRSVAGDLIIIHDAHGMEGRNTSISRLRVST